MTSLETVTVLSRLVGSTGLAARELGYVPIEHRAEAILESGESAGA
jgi:hypothetical protein